MRGADMGTVHQLAQHRFEQDQKVPEFHEWLAGMDSALARFFAEDAPAVGRLDDPWSAEGLRLAEEAARATFGDLRTALDPTNTTTRDRFGRFVGQVFCRRFEGEWVNAPDEPRGLHPMVREPYRLLLLDAHDLLGLAFVKGTKKIPLHAEGELAWVYGNSVRDYNTWVADGRPSIQDWLDSLRT